MPIKIDKTKWSASSRRSSEYTRQLQNVDYYTESIGYRCKKCFKHCVFTPEDQKAAFEEEKRIIHYVPSLCRPCAGKYEELKARNENYQTAWNLNRKSLALDREFISSWLELVKEKNSYGKRVDRGRERMLSKLLLAMPYE